MALDAAAFADSYRSRSDSGREQALFALESQYTPELLEVLLAIAADTGDYDLARIEAVKVLGLSAADHPEIRTRVVDFLLDLATDDPDDDVRVYAVLSIGWLPATATIRERLQVIARSDPDVLVGETAQILCDRPRSSEE